MNDKDHVRIILADFEQRIRAILDKAWFDWLKMPKRGILSARSRASIVFDFIKTTALAEFDGNTDIHAIVDGQTVPTPKASVRISRRKRYSNSSTRS